MFQTISHHVGKNIHGYEFMFYAIYHLHTGHEM